MSTCRRIYSIVQEPANVWLPSEAIGKVEVVNLLHTYEDGALRPDNYDRAAAIIISALAETECVGYVTYGNPLSYDSVAAYLVRYAEQSGTPFHVVPGVSSIDTLLCDIGIDMAPGLQIYEASWLVVARITLQPEVAVIVLQIGAFGSFRSHYSVVPSPDSLAGLVSYLTRFYPRSHRVLLVRSAGQRDTPANVRGTELGNLCDSRAEDIVNASMYIPALRPSQLDKQILEKMIEV